MEETWAIVELMGHVRLAGRLTEEEKFGAKMGRLDIPAGHGCTGISAGWCPVCGDCVCKDELDKNDEACPLHSESSRHGEVQGEKFVTQYFGGGSVYRITFVTEEVARHVAKSASPAPVGTWDFPKRLAATPTVTAGNDSPQAYEPDDDDDEDDYHDHHSEYD
jgi:hypothetical protein